MAVSLLSEPEDGSPDCDVAERCAVVPLRLDQHSGLGEAVENLAVKQLFRQRVVEATAAALPPWQSLSC